MKITAPNILPSLHVPFEQQHRRVWLPPGLRRSRHEWLRSFAEDLVLAGRAYWGDEMSWYLQ